MNRTALGLAVGAGYVLGRTKKAKLALAVGTLVAGKKLQLNPAALAQAVTRQIQDNPQFKEIGDQLRQDLKGVGKAATGTLLDRPIGSLADRLHDRTLDVRDRIEGVVPGTGSDGSDDGPDDGSDDGPEDAGERDEPAAERASGKARGTAKRAAKTAKSRSTGSREPRQTSARQQQKQQKPKKATAAKKTTAGARRSRKTAGAKGGGDDD
ncbi:DNA primase [Streptomyces sp. G45]|uniref:DNA primase n=1 Tax=Streptomyces sp. G45 TaxID=3406627 RepID=UPI003C2634DB